MISRIWQQSTLYWSVKKRFFISPLTSCNEEQCKNGQFALNNLTNIDVGPVMLSGWKTLGEICKMLKMFKIFTTINLQRSNTKPILKSYCTHIRKMDKLYISSKWKKHWNKAIECTGCYVAFISPITKVGVCLHFWLLSI